MIDLHCHSRCSDGTLSPEEIAERGCGFAAFALTDHDTVDGAERFLAACRGHSGVRLAGVELSIEPGEGYGKFHLLGLGVDPSNPALSSFLGRIRDGREERNVEIARRLEALGMPVTREDLAKYARERIVARPHFARVLIEKGWATGVKDAFERFLGTGRPAYAPRYRPSQAAAIEAVHAAGGVAVMAHPRFWTDDPEALRRGLVGLMELGLDGIEAIYQANEPGETIEHLRIARSLGLIVTAGSDFHGENKPTIHLGMDVDRESELVGALLGRISSHRALRT